MACELRGPSSIRVRAPRQAGRPIVAVYATYATPLGHGLVDRDLYVQKEWFATKPQLAKAQAERALDAGLAPAWTAGDEVYGRSSGLRELLEARGIGYVFAVGLEDDFQDSKQATCLDGTQVRGYTAWKRHVTLVMAAYALLTVTAVQAKAAHPAPSFPTTPTTSAVAGHVCPGRAGYPADGDQHAYDERLRRIIDRANVA
jgi:SRSO17 transposase